MQTARLHIVIPVFNEEAVLPHLKQRLTSVLNKHFNNYECKIILVDDGSTDKSPQLLKEYAQNDSRFQPIFCPQNIGHHMAIQKGVMAANADFTVIMDADLQDEPEKIPLIFEELKTGFDIVYTKRLERKGESFLKRKSSLFFWKFIHFFTALPIIENQSMLRIFSKKVLQSLQEKEYKRPFYPRIFAETTKKNHLRYSVIPVTVKARKYGESHYTLSQLLRLAWVAMQPSK